MRLLSFVHPLSLSWVHLGTLAGGGGEVGRAMANAGSCDEAADAEAEEEPVVKEKIRDYVSHTTFHGLDQALPSLSGRMGPGVRELVGLQREPVRPRLLGRRHPLRPRHCHLATQDPHWLLPPGSPSHRANLCPPSH